MKKVDKIITRMYRIGTGDCFALKFMSGTETTFNMLIDCGACKGSSDRFTDFAEDINTFVEGHLNLLVVTHEHLDHIIGFARANEVFKKIKIDNVWLAWTEDPDNPVADELREKWGKEKNALKNAAKAIKEDAQNDTRTFAAKEYFSNSLMGLTELYFSNDEILGADASGGTEMSKAMKWIKSLENIHYCYPSKLGPQLSGTEGIRFYFLGPPQDTKAIMTDEIDEDLYERNPKKPRVSNFVEALTTTDNDELSPFSAKYSLTKQEYSDFENKYLKDVGVNQNDWRSIENDWLYGAGELAIRLEKNINNTSLAMAIEFVDSGKVLLFPGDAQSGNWKSWHNTNLVKWEVEENGQKRTVFAKDLLNKTVLYKVGHHCSHNGTASQSGLELMKNDDLMALIPLDHNVIHPGWLSTMPTNSLYKRLAEKTKGRMFRIDEGLDVTIGSQYRDKMTSAEKAKFNNTQTVTQKFVEVIIEK